ncbi:class A beta-lactamase [Actinomadura barringtoniae]|uniref:Class A beta-lactamase n=1 Tax=Actinomadura barringtoniae TaxID=1427535 RepID=A0A939PBK5_9ACTN|nr:class A beta-lactamase [Actinomadura barringtoniae]MBO2447048.1 class A beta-lactamase [Actinomadura barringtoniae]
MTTNNPRLRTKLGIAVVAASALLGGAACGTSGSTVHGSTVAFKQATAPATPATARADLRKQLSRMEADYDGRIGAYGIDLATGKTVGYRSHERFPFLSTFKTMACSAILQKARSTDPGLLDRVIHWKKSDEVETPNSVVEGHGDEGMPVSRLCQEAIIRSDNTAANLVMRQIGGPPGVTRYIRSIGDPISRLDRWEGDLNIWNPREKRDTTMPALIGRDLTRVAVGGALDPRDRATLNGWLRGNLTGDERIRAGLPKTWTIGDKTGSAGSLGYAAANDIAVAWPPGAKAPLVLAIYTNKNAAVSTNDNKVIANTATLLAKALGRL